MAYIKLQQNELDEAEEFLIKALDSGLNSTSDMAAASLNLVSIYLIRKDFSNARAFLEEAKRLPHREKFNVAIDEMQKQLDSMEDD